MAQRNVAKLSGGQQQRVVLARALVHNPQMLLLDEPLSNLNARLREIMRFEIRRIQPGMKPGDPVAICIRPQDVEFTPSVIDVNARNLITGKISDIVQMGNYVEYEVNLINQKISCQSTHDLHLTVGSSVGVIFKPDYCICVIR